MFDYPRRVPLFLYFHYLYFSSYSGSSSVLHQPATGDVMRGGGNVALSGPGWPQQWALLGRYDLYTLAAGFPAQFCQVHLDSAPPLSRVIISPWKSPLMLAAPLATQKRATCPEICVEERFWASAGLCVCVCFWFEGRADWTKPFRLFGLLCGTSSQFIEAIRTFLFPPLLCNHRRLREWKVCPAKLIA